MTNRSAKAALSNLSLSSPNWANTLQTVSPKPSVHSVVVSASVLISETKQMKSAEANFGVVKHRQHAQIISNVVDVLMNWIPFTVLLSKSCRLAGGMLFPSGFQFWF